MAKDRVAQMRDRHSAAYEVGRTANGAAPFGYRLQDGGGLIEHEDEQEMVTEAVRLRDQGRSWSSVAETLGRQGYRSRTGGELSRQGVMANVRACLRWREKIADITAAAKEDGS